MGITARMGTALALAALAGCGALPDPGNLFGAPRFGKTDAVRASPARPVVDEVISLEAAPTPSGAIVSAVGLPPTQGYWEAELVRVPAADPAVLLLDFALLPPRRMQAVGTQPSREVLGGAVFTTQELAGIRTITVQGARNSQSVRRN